MTLTKEWLLKTIAELEEERDAVPGVVNVDAANALAAMKLALASLESEAVGYIDAEYAELLKSGHIESCSVYAESGEGCCPVYTAQPAAVSVPLAIHDEDFEKALSVLNDTLDDCGDSERGLLLALDKVGIAFRSDACRAAMLQGAEPVMTAYKLPFEQWLSQQTGTIDVECGCVMTEVFFHWLRVAYEAGNSPVIPDGWVLVPVEPTMSQEFAGYRTLTDTGKMSRLMKTRLSNIYRAMIATAPQQEVK
ncbi:hypothetical protein [Enterobacter hormaechei]|uniref:hypothetical protein n=1 Tax=Enterobacter hormaechei TaxID=158836 RepID=UPI002074D124|nr:hypothetical protein [Enterobacter hormaechei]MCM8295109.1 hypothetical protein [Enterobacter hormaechei]MCM8301124.1 hypothetical protein [Enterobacter hormaechei]MDF3794442.1 hypothetical protein [Enterobacter hormaechei]MDF3805220.1 hypothetical protein [Enterobacter hormaechei]